jgi:SAM-dependent methyltransferase
MKPGAIQEHFYMTFGPNYFVKLAKRPGVNAWLYSFIYRGFRKISKKHGVHITTNNYGYHPTKIEAYGRYQLQMYEEYVHLLEDENVEDILEIGCGAGGGIMHMKSRLPHAHFTGMDRCKQAVKTCNYFFDEQQKNLKLYTCINDIFTDGKKFNAVVSVETHIYRNPHMLSNIHNLLNEGGVFIYYDNIGVNRLDGLNKSICEHGFQIELFKDITGNVLNACDRDTPRRLEIAERYMPEYLIPFKRELLEYMCIKGSARYVNFSNGIKKSFLLKARKINRLKA